MYSSKKVPSNRDVRFLRLNLRQTNGIVNVLLPGLWSTLLSWTLTTALNSSQQSNLLLMTTLANAPAKSCWRSLSDVDEKRWPGQASDLRSRAGEKLLYLKSDIYKGDIQTFRTPPHVAFFITHCLRLVGLKLWNEMKRKCLKSLILL